MKSLFEFKSYKDYLRALIKNEDTRGLLSKLASAAECQRSYLSKVLQPDSAVHLTPDHIFGICEYLQVPEIESKYLSLLLERDRASQSKYRRSLEIQLAAVKHQYLTLSKQLGKEKLGGPEEKSTLYYSYWLYSALHIAVSIPHLQTVPALSKRFALPEETLLFYLRELEKIQLVQETKGKWSWVSGDLHLARDSAWILQHHSNWRNQALQNVSLRQPDALHYSLVQSISYEDFEALRLAMTEWIERFQRIATPSSPQELICFNLDYFRVGALR